MTLKRDSSPAYIPLALLFLEDPSETNFSLQACKPGATAFNPAARKHPIQMNLSIGLYYFLFPVETELFTRCPAWGIKDARDRLGVRWELSKKWPSFCILQSSSFSPSFLMYHSGLN